MSETEPSADRTSTSPGRAATWLFRATVAAALGVGLFVRFRALLAQTPFHDEWHALLAVQWWSAGRIFQSFGHADHSIPIALYLKSLVANNLLTSATLWLPFAIAGLAGPAILARQLSRQVGDLAAWSFAAFLWLSPLMVYFSRLARPYVVTGPVCLLLVVALRRWLDDPSPRRTILWSIGAAITGWALPVHLPFLLAPLAWVVLGRRRTSRGWILAAGTCALLAALLLPPLLADASSLGRKLRGPLLGPRDLLAAGTIFPGDGSPILLVALLALAAFGAYRLRSSSPAFTSLLLLAMVAQTVAVLVVHPSGSSSPFVAARYLLPVGLSILVLACVGLVAATAGTRLRTATVPIVLGVVAAGLWLPRHIFLAPAPDNFASTTLFHFTTRNGPIRELGDVRLPDIYAVVGKPDSDSRAIAEAPYNGYLRVPYGFYQMRHRRTVFLGVEMGFCGEPSTREIPPYGSAGFRIDRFVSLGDPAELRSRGVRYLFLHRDPENEIPGLRSFERKNQRFDFDRCLGALRSALGTEPALEAGIARFDLDVMPASAAMAPAQPARNR